MKLESHVKIKEDLEPTSLEYMVMLRYLHSSFCVTFLCQAPCPKFQNDLRGQTGEGSVGKVKVRAKLDLSQDFRIGPLCDLKPFVQY